MLEEPKPTPEESEKNEALLREMIAKIGARTPTLGDAPSAPTEVLARTQLSVVEPREPDEETIRAQEIILRKRHEMKLHVGDVVSIELRSDIRRSSSFPRDQVFASCSVG